MNIILPSLVAAVLASMSAKASSADELLSLRLWTNPKAKVIQHYAKRVAEHPCGEVVEIRTNRLPPYQRNAYLQPERAFEIGADGAVLRTWVMPVDSYVLGVDGDSLYVEVHKRTLVVTLDRRVRRAGQVPAFAQPAEANCQVPGEIAPSNYAGCLAFRDASSARELKIVYEFACT